MVLAKHSSRVLKGRVEDFELIKENKYGSTVFAKIYLKKTGQPRCRVSKGRSKNLIDLNDLVDENFTGSCILRVYQAFIGRTKTISISVEEILARNMEKTSYFADEDEDSDSEDEE